MKYLLVLLVAEILLGCGTVPHQNHYENVQTIKVITVDSTTGQKTEMTMYQPFPEYYDHSVKQVQPSYYNFSPMAPARSEIQAANKTFYAGSQVYDAFDYNSLLGNRYTASTLLSVFQLLSY